MCWPSLLPDFYLGLIKQPRVNHAGGRDFYSLLQACTMYKLLVTNKATRPQIPLKLSFTQIRAVIPKPHWPLFCLVSGGQLNDGRHKLMSPRMMVMIMIMIMIMMTMTNLKRKNSYQQTGVHCPPLTTHPPLYPNLSPSACNPHWSWWSQLFQAHGAVVAKSARGRGSVLHIVVHPFFTSNVLSVLYSTT